jgi:NAD-dependent dihydropyrimidine dehydrogenase PreA subunit
MDIFRMDEETGKAFIKYIRDCQCCSLCEVDCPEGAISVMPFYERRMPRAW